MSVDETASVCVCVCAGLHGSGADRIYFTVHRIYKYAVRRLKGSGLLSREPPFPLTHANTLTRAMHTRTHIYGVSLTMSDAAN